MTTAAGSLATAIVARAVDALDDALWLLDGAFMATEALGEEHQRAALKSVLRAAEKEARRSRALLRPEGAP